MKNLPFVLLLGLALACQAPAEEKAPASSTETTTAATEGFDAALAEKYGADDYGMKQYVMAFLKAGPNRDQDSLTAANLQTGHLKNIGRLAEEGKLVLAGRFLDETDLRGIYIFNVTTVEEAAALTNSDPAVQAGRLVMELHPWYGSAAMMEINDLHRRVAKLSF